MTEPKKRKLVSYFQEIVKSKQLEDIAIRYVETKSKPGITLSERNAGLGIQAEGTTADHGLQTVTTTRSVECPYFEHTDISYGDLLLQSPSIASILKDNGAHQEFIGIAVKRGPTVPILMLGVLEAGCAFFSVDHGSAFEETTDMRNLLKCRNILVDHSFFEAKMQSSSYDLVVPIEVGNFQIYLVQLKTSYPSDHLRMLWEIDNYAYAIRTSGTTGSTRVVLVPHSGIMCNMRDFAGIFRVTSEDVILSISPATFDPFIIDVFLAFGTGATLLITSDSIRFVPGLLSSILEAYQPTILQCTPSILMSLHYESKKVFCDLSKLRVLALGGEKCPKKSLLRKIIGYEKYVENQKLELFNLYGITEVSCWASVEKVNVACTECEDVPVGKALNATRIDILPSAVTSEGEVLIGFTEERECLVFNEQDGTRLLPFELGEKIGYKFLQTGDFAKIHDCKTCSSIEDIKFTYVDRKDRIRKRNGVKVDLGCVERIALQMEEGLFSSAYCLQWKTRLVLLLKLVDCNVQAEPVIEKLHRQLRYKLKFENHPDRIVITTDELPINKHGKLDVAKIMELENDFHELKRSPSHKLLQCYSIGEKDCRTIFEKLWRYYTRTPVTSQLTDALTFTFCGGNSVSATRFVEDFFSRIQKFGSKEHAENEKLLISALLSEPFHDAAFKFYDVVRRIQYDLEVTKYTRCTKSAANLHDTKSKKHHESARLNSSQQRNNLCSLILPPMVDNSIAIPIGLCVDAAPSFFSADLASTICVIGSHSGDLFAFNLTELPLHNMSGYIDIEMMGQAILWKAKLGGRIECSVTVHPEKPVGYVGCHDGSVYSLDLKTGRTIWFFSIDAEIRSSPTLDPKGDFIIVSSPKKVYSMNANHGALKWIHCSTAYVPQSFSACASSQNVIIATVAGLTCLNASTGVVVWTVINSKICNSPLFVEANGQIDENLVIFGTTDGAVLAIAENSGVSIWCFNPSSYEVSAYPPNAIAYYASRGHSFVVYTNHVGEVIRLNCKNGNLLGTASLSTPCRSKPCVILSEPKNDSELDDSLERGETESFVINTVDGRVFWTLLDNSGKTFGIHSFGMESAESFSSPVLEPNLGILAVGSRDNCIHFIKLKIVFKTTVDLKVVSDEQKVEGRAVE